jgi:Na+/melibiose symporter-like transporter
MRIPIALIALLCVPLIARRVDQSRPRAQQPFDLTGSAMIAGGMALLLLAPALIRAPSDVAMALPIALAGTVLMAAFIRRERTRAEPFLPTAIARNRDFQVINLAGIIVQFTCFAVPLITPYFLLRMLNWSPMACGAMLAIWSVGSLLGSSLATRCIAAYGVRRSAGLAGLAIVLGLAGVAGWPRDVMPAIMLGCLLLHGFGLGLFQVAYSDLVIGTLPLSSRGVAGSRQPAAAQPWRSCRCAAAWCLPCWRSATWCAGPGGAPHPLRAARGQLCPARRAAR